jgi:YegS/Rv2252/BmrU family lipid kinase
MRTFAVVNPRSGNGRTGRMHREIVTKLSGVCEGLTVGLTRGPMDAAALTSQALLDGFEQIVAVGGDGTINEVVNGFFRDGAALNPTAHLALLTNGTGGDFRRTFGIEDGLDASVRRIGAGRPTRIDVGRLTFVTDDGKPELRYFANIASFGMSGDVVRRVNRARISKLFGGKFAFRSGAMRAALAYVNKPVRLKVDTVFDEVVTVSTVAICNGKYFGGGMKVAPDALPDDGMFDVIVLGDAPRGETIKAMNAIYTGEHIKHPSVKVLRGASVIATPVQATARASVFLDVDGEAPGQLPAMFDVLHKAISFRC